MQRPDRRDHRAFLALSAPLAATQLTQVALSTTDIAMRGFLGTAAIAGGGLAIVLFNQVRTMGVGLLTGTANLVAAAEGARGEVRRIAFAAMLIATATGALGALILVGIGFGLEFLGQDAAVAEQARVMLFALAPGLVPCLWFQVLRQVTVGLRRPLQLLWVTLASVALNAFLNLAFILGWGPFPAWGVAGIGAATSVVYLAQAAALLILTRRDAVVREALRAGGAGNGQARRILRLGVPTALTFGSEAGLFSVLALLAGGLGAAALAAYNIVNQITYIVFQTAVGASHAASVMVSREPASARRWATVAITQQFALVTVVGLVYLVAGEWIVRRLGADASPEAVALGATVLLVAALTQYVDAAQNIAVGLLRSVDLAGASFRYTLVGYWLVGLPAAALLAFGLDLGLVGLWTGLGLGLAACAGLMLRRFRSATSLVAVG